MPGGFIGVDVFFVVSGFVITMQLGRELDRTGSVNLRQFYTRRVRRLLPALAAVTLATLAAGSVILSPITDQPFAARTARAASAFVANLFLFRSGGGYFDPAEERNPFLHTWTLSVEEQFYFILPIVLLIAWRVASRNPRADRPRFAAGVVAIATIASFAAGWSLTVGAGPLSRVVAAPERFAFYSPVSRAWEFGVGVALALVGPRLIRRLGSASSTMLALAGLGCIAFASFWFDRSTPFPGTAAVVPVSGAALMLVSGSSDGPIARLLSQPLLVWIGDRSYGWYLWHWPAIVIARVLWPANTLALLLAAFGSLVPAALSYRYLEQVIRSDPRIVGRRVIVLAAACIAVPVLASVAVTVAADRDMGLRAPEGWTDRRLAVRAGCDGKKWSRPRCSFDVPQPKGTVLLIGDSHAASASDGVVAAAGRLGYDTVVWFNSGCPFLVGRAPVDDEDCRTWQRNTLAFSKTLRPDLVVIANRSSGYTLPDFPAGEHWLSIADRNGNQPDSRSEALQSWQEGFDNALERISKQGAATLVLSVVPEFTSGFGEGLSLLRPDPGVPVVSVDDVDRRRNAVLKVEAAAARRYDRVARLDPASVLCADGQCRAVRDGVWLYMDRQHLTPNGSLLLTDSLAASMRELLDT